MAIKRLLDFAPKPKTTDDGDDGAPPPTKPEVARAKRAANERHRDAEVEKELAALKRRLRR